MTLVLVLLAGVAGLAFVFTDVLVVPPGLGRIALAGLCYVVIGCVIGRIQAGGRPFRWALACGWGTAVLGAIGLWVSLTDSGGGDIPLALVFLLGPAAAAAAGVWIAARGRSEPA